MQLKRPRAILFDLDGTLADTAPDLAGAINRMRASRGLAPSPFALLREAASTGARGLLKIGFGITPEDGEYSAMRHEFFDAYEAGLAIDSILFDGVHDLLAQLHAQDIRWGIVTNKIARFSEPFVRQIGLEQTACLISGDTMPNSKPHPAPLFEAARRMNLAPEDCWYVGDDLRDIEAGRAAGMLTLAAAWGYGGHTDMPSWGADHQLALPTDILALVTSR
jgi:2-phosphoglycolate phosphatase